MEDKKKQILDLAKRIELNYTTGYLEAGKGYKFRVKEFLDIVFLFINSVDTKNPDLLGIKNRNTFIYEAQEVIDKIKEQIHLDLKDFNFLINGASSLGNYIMKGANRKILKDNHFNDQVDEAFDNAIDFGSGYLKVWIDEKGKLKIKSVDTLKLMGDLYNFTDNAKLERIRTTYQKILDNEKYFPEIKEKILNTVKKEDRNKSVILHQMVDPQGDDKNQISVVNLNAGEEAVYYFKDNNTFLKYYKIDYKKRQGFTDALGRGANELVFNQIVQNKVNRERMDKVMEIASNLQYQKEIDGERENLVGKDLPKFGSGKVLGYRNGKKIEVMNVGGDKQVAFIRNELNSLVGGIGKALNVGDALGGKTLPSGTSGALGNLLSENQSTVHKDTQEKMARPIARMYNEKVNPYLLKIFDKSENLRKYLDPNDIRLVKESIIDYLTLVKQIDARINDTPFDLVEARNEAKTEIKGKNIISGDLLEQLRNEVLGIEAFITGENRSKLQLVAMLREMRSTYASRPELFADPFYVNLIKKEAEMESGISGLEIDEALKDLQT